MKPNSLRPFIKFNILDNPYGCANNIFKLEFSIPLHLNVWNTHFKMQQYSMIWDKDTFIKNKNIYFDSVNKIYPKINTLIKDYLINNQTCKLDENSFKIIYKKPIKLNITDLNKYVLYPNFDIIKLYSDINSTDVYIPFILSNDKEYINQGVWKCIN